MGTKRAAVIQAVILHDPVSLLYGIANKPLKGSSSQGKANMA